MIELSKVKIGIVVSKFNDEYTELLLKGAVEAFEAKGLSPSQLKIVHVPGAFEIPLASQKLIETGGYDAIVALGAVIRGDTYHFEVVCNEVARGVQNVSLETGVPVIFGVITTDNDEQAMDRCGGKHGNKGRDAALAALEMIEFIDDLKE